MLINVNNYLRLIRWYSPQGTLLLAWPSLWVLSFFLDGREVLASSAIFLIGAFLMRSGGCIINDMTDRELDAKVARTKNRPLASGEIPLWHAYVLLLLFLAMAAAIAFCLGTPVLMASLFVLPLIVLYPWMKRLTFWPQLFLGVVFNYGVILASIASIGTIHPAAILFYLGAILWTLGYDTIYGYQDIADDISVGIKSTARLFGDDPVLSLSAIYAGALTCWAAAGYVLGERWTYYALLTMVAGHFIWQIRSLDISNAELCGRIFKSNAWLGGGMFLLLLILV